MSNEQVECDARNAATSARETADFRARKADRWVGYLSNDGRTLTTWTGETLATVTRTNAAKVGGFGGKQIRYYLRAVGIDGRNWSATSPGPCMFARMRVCK